MSAAWVTVTRVVPVANIETVVPLKLAMEEFASTNVKIPVLFDVATKLKSESAKSLLISSKLIEGFALFTTRVIVAIVETKVVSLAWVTVTMVVPAPKIVTVEPAIDATEVLATAKLNEPVLFDVGESTKSDAPNVLVTSLNVIVA